MKHPRRILLVEGPNDRHVIWALLQRHQLPEVFEVQVLDGIDHRIESARVRLKALQSAGELERIGLIVDADESRAERWEQVRSAIKESTGFLLPAQPDRDGTSVDIGRGRRFGAWLMPDNLLPGKLEDFLAFLVPSGDALLPHVDGFLGTLPEQQRCPARFAEKDRTKARIFAWLSVQREPGKPLGQAITARYLDADAEVAVRFVHWLRRLFVDP